MLKEYVYLISCLCFVFCHINAYCVISSCLIRTDTRLTHSGVLSAEREKQLIDIRETLVEMRHDGKRQMRMMIGLGTCVAVETEREGPLTTDFYSASELVWLPMH